MDTEQKFKNKASPPTVKPPHTLLMVQPFERNELVATAL